jgi:hypothetical protein
MHEPSQSGKEGKGEKPEQERRGEERRRIAVAVRSSQAANLFPQLPMGEWPNPLKKSIRRIWMMSKGGTMWNGWVGLLSEQCRKDE